MIVDVIAVSAWNMSTHCNDNFAQSPVYLTQITHINGWGYQMMLNLESESSFLPAYIWPFGIQFQIQQRFSAYSYQKREYSIIVCIIVSRTHSV